MVFHALAPMRLVAGRHHDMSLVHAEAPLHRQFDAHQRQRGDMAEHQRRRRTRPYPFASHDHAPRDFVQRGLADIMRPAATGIEGSGVVPGAIVPPAGSAFRRGITLPGIIDVVVLDVIALDVIALNVHDPPPYPHACRSWAHHTAARNPAKAPRTEMWISGKIGITRPYPRTGHHQEGSWWPTLELSVRGSVSQPVAHHVFIVPMPCFRWSLRTHAPTTRIRGAIRGPAHGPLVFCLTNG